MSYLKTKYPCVDCGELVQVRSKREAEFARCSRCCERARLGRSANHHHFMACEIGKRHGRRAHDN